MRWYRPFLYFWASPATLIGLSMVPLATLRGGRARIVRGVIEAHGGIITWLLTEGLPWVGSGAAAAMTLGHVVWGCDETCLNISREHERVHVAQYERWGPLFIPAYLIASLTARLKGLDPYLDNPFEREAFSRTDNP